MKVTKENLGVFGSETTASSIERLAEAARMAVRDSEKMKRTQGKWPRKPEL